MQESQISKYYSTLPPHPSTVIPNRYIIKHPIAIWWHQILSGGEFFDGPSEANSKPQGPTIHQFRSSCLQLEEEYLHQCWERCLNEAKVAQLAQQKMSESHGHKQCEPLAHKSEYLCRNGQEIKKKKSHVFALNLL